MSLNVISNYAANVALRTLQKSDTEATTSLAKLSAGTRVLSAKDDAASLAIGQRLRSDVAALRMASVNAGQASSMLQIADSAMSTVSDVLTRMKVLATQSASGQVTGTERAMLQQEFGALQKEIERITDTTRFSDQVLLKGEGASAPSTVQRGIKINAGGLQSDIKGTGTDANAGPTATIAIGTTQLASLSTDDKVIIQIQGGEEFDVALAGTETTVADIADTLNSDTDFQKVAAAYVDTKGNLAIRTLPGAEIGGTTYAAGQMPQIVTARLSYAGLSFTAGSSTSEAVTFANGGDIDTSKITQGVKSGDVVRVTFNDDSVFDITISSDNVTDAGGSNIGAIFEAISNADYSSSGDYIDLSGSTLDDEETISFVNSGSTQSLLIAKVQYFVGGVTESIGTKTGVTDTALKQGVGSIDLSSAKLATGDTLNFDVVDATGAVTEESYTITDDDVTGGVDALITNLNNSFSSDDIRFEKDGAYGIKFSSTVTATDSAGSELGVYSIRNVSYEVDNDNQNAASWIDMDLGGRTLSDGDTISFTVAGEKRSLTLDQTTTGLNIDDIVSYINSQTSNGQVGEDVTASNVEGMLRLESSGATVKFTEASFTGVDGSVLSGNGGSVAGKTGGAVFEVTFQIGAYTSAADQLTVQIQNVGTEALGVSENAVNILSSDAATSALTSVNEAINRVQGARATIGAQQNRLDYAMQALGTQAENMEAARSNLMDLDVASEMSAFTSKSILQQAGVSMLAQANQMPRNLLRLFQ